VHLGIDTQSVSDCECGLEPCHHLTWLYLYLLEKLSFKMFPTTSNYHMLFQMWNLVRLSALKCGYRVVINKMLMLRNARSKKQ
jgi:hypothetical protein